MSATDSDNSIDWLASDDEDHESEREPDCTGRTSQTQGPDVAAPLPVSPRRRRGSSENGGRCCSSTEAKQGDGSWGEVSEASSRGSSSSCLETWDSDASGQCHAEQLPRSNGKSAAQALKRPLSAAPEQHKERPLNSNESEKDHLFTRKCVELQCYINPLSSILNGLRTGRYRQRLSSFQESVAMDRIQRIMGVLQKPCMGERYVNIILKMEEMLKSWFPNVKRDQHTVIQSEEAVPTKRLKLSAVTTTLTGAAAMPVTVGAPLPGAKTPRVTDLTPPGASSASNLKWLHTSPIRSPTAEQAQAGPRHLPPPRDRAKTQDNAVSSSTDSGAKTDSIPRGPPLCKISAPCLERLLKSTESIITHKGVGRGTTGRSWS